MLKKMPIKMHLSLICSLEGFSICLKVCTFDIKLIKKNFIDTLLIASFDTDDIFIQVYINIINEKLGFKE